MAVKFEKITLWTATQTYSVAEVPGLSALDYMLPAIEDGTGGDLTVLDYDSEEYTLTKKREKRGSR